MRNMLRPFLVLVCVICIAGLGRVAFEGWVVRTELPLILGETSTEIRDRNSTLLRAYQVGNGIWRLSVHPDRVDPTYRAMLIRFEDKRFWHHNGVDPLAMLRAVGQMLWEGGHVSGGSTLTMQVARLLEDGTTGRWAGKLRQIRVALALERRLDKSKILQLYLTHAPFGANIEGVRAASLAWFGKEPTRLTPAQAALLVALPQSPESRRPDRHPIAARDARDRVLARMVQQGVIDPAHAISGQRAGLPGRMQPFPRLAAHLADQIRTQSAGQTRHDLTIDANIQTRVERLASQAARAAGPRLSTALVVANHETGEVLASVGSAGYADTTDRQGFVDMTQATRSPGSLLKPVIYGLAFDQGLAHPETLIHDGPVSFGRYAPQNFDGRFRGDVRVRDALRQSLNIPVVKLTQTLGPARVLDALQRSGATVEIPGGKPGLAIALGGLGMTLSDLVQLYAALPQGGQGPRLRVRRDAHKGAHGRLMSPSAAWQVGDILTGATPPPGARAGVLAYKTGTSYGHRDAWAIGYDGRHVIGVWMGRADGTPVPGAFGGDLAAPVLFQAFGLLKPDFDRLQPPPPETLIVASADLPLPLQRFRPRGMVSTGAYPPVELTFPPNGARLSVEGDAVTLKLRGGQAPFTILANGRPLATGLHRREFDIPNPGTGFSTLVVLDRNGQSDRATVRLD